MKTYTAHTLVNLSCQFETSAGVNTDPTAVVCSLMLPDGTIVVLPTTNTSVGNYVAQYLPTVPGIYQYEFIGSGVLPAAAVSKFGVSPTF